MTARSEATGRPATLTELYFEALDRFEGEPVALRFKRANAWRDIAYAEVAHRVKAQSLGMVSLGIEPGDRVAILSENRSEWALADFACLTARAIDVPIYPTLLAAQIRYLLQDAGCRGIFVSTAAQLAKITEIRGELPALEWVVLFDPPDATDQVLSLDALEAKGRMVEAEHPGWRDHALAAKPDELATIIYTSGTTGEPKGVMLTHGNIASNVRSACQMLTVGSDDECLSLLPLSHIFERMTGHFSMFYQGVTINYAQSIETVAQDLLEIRPTIVAAVPRLYEKVYAKALETATRGSDLTRSIFFWAKAVGDRWADGHSAGQPIGFGLRLQHAIADRLVFRRVRAGVGGKLRLFLSGGAPLSIDIARFFYAAGMPILEGYGLTETSPVITVNSPGRHRLGTVGPAIPGVEIRIASDGEILTRGPNVMAGYYRKPEATAEVLDENGWFRTGDIGEIDGDGFLRITDRKKDLIATAGGKKIAPQPIEERLRQSKLIANAVMLGDRRKFPIVLIAPDFERLREWAAGNGVSATTPEQLVVDPKVVAHLEAEAEKQLDGLARYEMPKRFLIIPRSFSIETGELTPKLSVKRRVVEEHYRNEIDALYLDAEEHVGERHS